MNKILRIVIIWALILSPVWVGLLALIARPYEQGDPVMMLRQAVGVAAIGIVGLVVSASTRRASNADTLSVVGYAVPAVLVSGYELAAALM